MEDKVRGSTHYKEMRKVKIIEILNRRPSSPFEYAADFDCNRTDTICTTG